MSKIVLENVSKRYGDSVAVDCLNLEINSGAFFSIVGPSGCGKTTTMRMIAGLELPTSGKIWIGDKLVFSSDDSIQVPPGKRQVGMVFQTYALWPHMTVAENIAFGLKSRKMDKGLIAQKTTATRQSLSK
jgi:multiple sugar transport system ATP-binding protein